MKVTLTEMGKSTGPEIYLRCKIFKKGTSDWIGIIIGARALDCEERGGLGFRPGAASHIFEKLNIQMPRMESLLNADYARDEAY